ncbi:MAG: hypothetical protein PF517_18880 [Salinivirgaceae bacterium]|jgi:hypothetical protein|nr:hypothetical protein [Salinivirgaceae bacterium]
MQKTIAPYNIIVFLLVNVFVLQAQTGIYTFNSNDKVLPNVKISAISQTNNNNLVLLSICSDDKYSSHSIQLLTVNKDNLLENNSSIDVNNLFDVISINKKNTGEFTVFGNTMLNNQYEPFQLDIALNGEEKSNNKLPKVYSTLISDVISYDNNFMILYSKVGKNELYNISLHKVNAATGNIEWLKKISSENNEEADKIAANTEGFFYILGKKYNDEVTEFVPVIYKIDKTGKQLWKKAINVPANFNKQSFQLTSTNNIIYVCGYIKNSTGISETRIIKLSSEGEEVHSNSIADFSANGIIGIDDDSHLIFGSKFIVDQKQIVTKGKYVIINNQLSDTFEKTLDKNDKPDVLLNSEIRTSSDFTCALKLEDNRIALGGKVYMPITNNNNIKNNAALLMLVNKDGTY